MPQLSYSTQTVNPSQPQQYTGYAYGVLPQTGGDFGARDVVPTYSPDVQAYLDQRKAYEAAHPGLSTTGDYALTAPAGRGGGTLYATDAQIRKYMTTPLEQQFAPYAGVTNNSGGNAGGLAVTPGTGVRVVDQSTGKTIFQGTGPDGATQALAIAQQMSDSGGKNADWSVDYANPDGTWSTGARDAPEINKFNKFAEVALPAALSLAVPGLGILGGALGSGVGAAGGSALSGVLEGKSFTDILKGAALSGLGAYAGSSLLGSLSGGAAGGSSSLGNLGIDWSGIRDIASDELGSALSGGLGGGLGSGAGGIVVNGLLPSLAPGLAGGALGGAGLSVLGGSGAQSKLPADNNAITVTGQAPPNLAVENFAGPAAGATSGAFGGDIVVNGSNIQTPPDKTPTLAVDPSIFGGSSDPNSIVVNGSQIETPTDSNNGAAGSVAGLAVPNPNDITVEARPVQTPPEKDPLAVPGDIFGNPPIEVATKPITSLPEKDPTLAIDPGVFDPNLDTAVTYPPGGGLPPVPPVPPADPFIHETAPPSKIDIPKLLEVLGLGAGLVGNVLDPTKPTVPPGFGTGGLGSVFTNPLPPANVPGGVGNPANLGQRPMTAQDWLRYGMRPEQSFFNYVPQNYTPPAPGVADPAWDNQYGGAR